MGWSPVVQQCYSIQYFIVSKATSDTFFKRMSWGEITKSCIQNAFLSVYFLSTVGILLIERRTTFLNYAKATRLLATWFDSKLKLWIISLIQNLATHLPTDITITAHLDFLRLITLFETSIQELCLELTILSSALCLLLWFYLV